MDPDAIAMARFLIRERDKAALDMERTRTFPAMTARAEGLRDGLELALAWLGGQYGYTDPPAFVAYIRGLPIPIRQEPPTIQRAMDGDR